MTEKYNVDGIINEAINFAKTNHYEYLMVDHLVWALLEDATVQKHMSAMGAKPNTIRSEIANDLHGKPDGKVPMEKYSDKMPKQTTQLTRVMQRAFTFLMFSGQGDLSPESLLLAILAEPKNNACAILAKHGINRETLVKQLKKGVKKGPNGESMLDKFCKNLNEESKNGRIDPVIGREQEIQDVIEVIARRKKNNAILVGKEGVGKTAIAEGLAKMIVDKMVPKAIEEKVVYSLDITTMLAGTKYRGEFEERMKSVLEEIKDDGNIILFIDEIHMIMGAGGSGNSPIDASNMMKPMLANGEMTCIGATTYDEFGTHMDKDRALMRRFQKIDINPPSIEDTKRILAGLATHYEKFHGITFTSEALDLCTVLSDRYIKTRFLPDKAIDLMDFAGAKAKLDSKPVVDVELVMERTAKMSKIPLDMIDIRDNEVLRTLDTKVKNKVFGQDNTIDLLVESIGLAKSGLREANKPIGSFLLVGPTGTGKTFVCKTLAKTMGIPLIKFDMSEYQEPHTVSRLIGAPPGYVGHGSGEYGAGQLISEVEKNPNCILLMDEIEKAAYEVLTVLLQVMEDGVLTSSTGKKVDFTNVILIMTSNLGAAEAEKRSIGIHNNTNTTKIKEAVERKLAPEFRNRIDHIIEFNKLSVREMDFIVESAIKELNERVATKIINVSVSEEARKWLAKNGYSETMGARPFKRLFENEVNKPLSKEILFGSLSDGGQFIVDCVDDKLVFSTSVGNSEKKMTHEKETVEV